MKIIARSPALPYFSPATRTIRSRPEERLARLQSPSAIADGGQVGGFGRTDKFSSENLGPSENNPTSKALDAGNSSP